MATKKQQNPPTTQDALAAYTGAASANVLGSSLGIGSLPTATTDSAPMRGNAIGVPPYVTDPTTGNIATYDQPVIDPTTGQQATGADGTPLFSKQPVPWTAQVSHMVGGSGFQGTMTQQVMPRYYEGAVEEILNNLPPNLLWQLQDAMIDARVYGSKNPNIQRGIPDQETSAAFRQVLTTANATGLDYPTVIQNYQKIAKSAPPPPPTPHITKVTNPTDLRAVFKTAARNAIGHELSDAEAQRYVNAFQGLEGQYGDQLAAAQDSGVNATVTAAPDPSAFLDEQLKQDQAGAYKQNALLGQVDAFRSMLTGPGLRTPGSG